MRRELRIRKSVTRFRPALALVFLGLLFLAGTEPAHAYIGPGAGFAFLGSFLALLATILLAFLQFLIWPFVYVYRRIRIARKRKSMGAVNTDVNRVVVVGLDGLDPDLFQRFRDEGILPNLDRLAKEGCFHPLATSFPSISPVAWSCFMTGSNPGKHNIFDFLTRDPKTYLPDLSSAEVGTTSRTISLGKYRIPIGKPQTKLLRKGKTFWSVLGDAGVFSTVLRVPITFPPEKFNGHLLSAMCVPDLKGTQGSFTFFTTRDSKDVEHTGGTQIQVRRNGNSVEGSIAGPENSLKAGAGEMQIPFRFVPNGNGTSGTLEIDGEKIPLETGKYTEWVTLVFKAGLGIKVNGIARFRLLRVDPEFDLYMTPINIDPEKPALPVSNPYAYAVYLAKDLGPYATLGLAEDTWGLNERVLDEEAFLEQTWDIHDEREKMFFKALANTHRGAVVCVFDTTDRIQHMFFRYLDENHPANRDKDFERHRDAIRDLYVRMDEMIERVRKELGEKDVLMIMSDHGFKVFRRGINLNTWLEKNGYLSRTNGEAAGGAEYFAGVDWENTRAYAVGLGGLFLNIRGREAKGTVEKGAEAKALKDEIRTKLTGLKDPDSGETAILDVFDTNEVYIGPYKVNAPDLLIGYNEGYRASWDSVVGKFSEQVFEDNIKSWGGDHCIDPRRVPGVFFANRKIDTNAPRIIDVGPTVLRLLGVPVPNYMDGEPLLGEDDGK
jgi:predicted AlkP superfamily phosphohydrolase/phosphomutase